MDKQDIEKVQCRATKIIPELRHYSYEEPFTEVIPTITCLQTAKRRNDIPIPTNSSVL